MEIVCTLGMFRGLAAHGLFWRRYGTCAILGVALVLFANLCWNDSCGPYYGADG